MNDSENFFMSKAIELASQNATSLNGGPFGAIIVKDGEIIAEGKNCVTSSNDPTAHAEMVAIRDACKKLGHFELKGCELYTSCEPCPMCLGAIYWTRLNKVYFAATKKDAAQAGFDDSFIYEQFEISPAQRQIPFKQINKPNANEPFRLWQGLENKIDY